MPWKKDYRAQGFTEREAMAIITACRRLAGATHHGSSVADRWAPFFAIMWHTARRLGEVLAIRPQDIDVTTLTFAVLKRKTPTVELCQLPPELAIELGLLTERHRVPRDGRIFPMTKPGVDQSLKRAAKAAGIERHVYSHMFRHGHARHLARSMQERGNTADQIKGAIRKALKHSGWSNLDVYLEPTDADLAEFQRAAFRH